MAAAPKAATALEAAHDLDLVALAKVGDRRAFNMLVSRHGSAVRGLLRRIGAASGLADEIARDAFIDAYEEIAEFRGEAPFQTWVKAIAARLWARRARRGPAASAPSAAGGGLDAALCQLAPDERACIGLCYGAGLSPAEAAEALNLPPASVKSNLMRGLDQLKARLAADAGEARAPADG